MSILRDVLAELFKLSVGDARQTLAILTTVLVVAAINFGTNLPPLAGGAVLLIGCLAVLMISVRRAARRRP